MLKRILFPERGPEVACKLPDSGVRVAAKEALRVARRHRRARLAAPRVRAFWFREAIIASADANGP